MFFSCSDDGLPRVDAGVVEGGLISVLTSLIVHKQSSQEVYDVHIKTFQGAVRTTKVEIYKQFISPTYGYVSNKMLYKTLDDEITPQNIQTHTFSTTFAELKEGLLIAGESLPEDEDLRVGDKIVLTYVSHTSEGNIHTVRGTTELTISARFAGVYTVLESDFWNVGAPDNLADWTGANRVIKSLNNDVYEHVGFGPYTTDDNGPEFHPDAFFLFGIDNENRIQYYKYTLNGQLVTGMGINLLTCEDNDDILVNIPCGAATNYAIKDDVDEKDRLIFSVGYYALSGIGSDPLAGPREFFEVLEKL